MAGGLNLISAELLATQLGSCLALASARPRIIFAELVSSDSERSFGCQKLSESQFTNIPNFGPMLTIYISCFFSSVVGNLAH